MWKRPLICCLAFLSISFVAAETRDAEYPPKSVAIEIPEDITVRTSEKNNPQMTHDARLEAYLQGLVDAKYAKYQVTVSVRNGGVILLNLPQDSIKANKIIALVRKFSSISNVLGKTDISLSDETALPGRLLTKHDYTGIWFPQSTILFPSQIANPRQVCFSVGPRFRDTCGGNVATAFSFGDQFPIYRWAHIWKWRGDLQLELEAGLFAVFNHDVPSFPMQNADYYVGIPLTYAVGPWAFRGRIYHISSHLGDEYMERHKHCHRRNKSFEAIDFFTSYQFTDGIRFFGGPGIIYHSDPDYHIDPLYAEYGMEVRAFRHNFTQLFGQPFLSMYFRNYQEENFRFDETFALGYEWGKIQGYGRKIRVFLEYHDGFSLEGQFSKRRTDYFGIKLQYGF